MKKIYNKGFTLVELLSVIALLATLAIIVIPNIDKLLKNSRNNLYSKQISSIETSAKLWATEEENLLLLTENETWPFVLTLSDLQTSGFIDKDIKNPKTDEKIPESLLIYINKENGKYTYSVDETSNDPLAPTITINGEKVVTLEINNTYSDAGATAIKPDGTSNPITTVIKKRGVSSSISNNEIVTYTITYSSEYTIDDITHKAIAVRVLKYVDTTNPVITCSSCINGTVIESTDNYTLPSVTVTDNSGERLTAIITGSFSSKIPGEKKVIYQATDSSGNTGILEVTYVVKDTIAPTFIYKVVEANTFEIIATDSGSGIKEYSFDDGKNWQKSNIGKFSCGENTTTTNLVVKDYANNISKQNVSVVCEQIWNFAYTGNYQQFKTPTTGWYQVDLWGASGGHANGVYAGGKGAYTSGKIYLIENEILDIYVGGEGNDSCSTVLCSGGYNGGGPGKASASVYQGSGGGATDVRYFGDYKPTENELIWNSDIGLKSRIMIAAGGGGGSQNSTSWFGNGGNGGTLFGTNATYGGSAGSASYPGGGGTQIAGGTGPNCAVGTFGISGIRSTLESMAGGGGGYYGGGCGWGAGGGGGSSFISGFAGVNAITSSSSLTPTNNTMHYSGKYFIDTKMASGVSIGNGLAKITYISYNKPERTNKKLNNVRYIKNCTNGSTSNTNNHPIEIQAIYNGKNLAKGITTQSTTTLTNPTYLTDGDITTANYATNGTGNQCIIIDLGKGYDLDEIATWQYFGTAGRIFYNDTTYVSTSNLTTWTVATDGQFGWNIVLPTTNTVNTSDGKRVNAYETGTTFTYTGGEQTYTAPYDGWYQIELWGAQGGTAKGYVGGKGAYTSGKIYLNKGEKLYLYVGGSGRSECYNLATEDYTGGYNGGGDCGYYTGGTVWSGAGGGATDVRYDGTSLNDRIMVSAGGGGSGWYNSQYGYGGNGGTLIGISGTATNASWPGASGGTQISGGNYGLRGPNGTFGTATNWEWTDYISGGGGGYYGGGGTVHAGAGGGSSFISGYAGVNAITSSDSLTPTNNTLHYSEKYFIDGKMIAGVNTGNGKAKITFISKNKPERINTKLNNVRYIKDCATGNAVDGYVYWTELQAITNGINIAFEKEVTSTTTINTSAPYSRITDGDITTTNYAATSNNSQGTNRCITIDLGQTYDLDEIAVWHLTQPTWPTFIHYNNYTYVSIDNSNWIEVINTVESETSSGKRISAYGK